MKETTFDTAFEEVKKLVADFKQSEKYYLLPSYSEASVREDFLNKFFYALGWDVYHDEQKNPYEQEVKIEKGVKVSGAQKRADYSFAIAPNYRDPKFFAEAKKPAKALKNAQDYFQSIRYGWHKAHPLSILTDFEEFHILDCRYTPDINNSLDKCYKRFHYTDYLNKEKFAEIYFLFSRESVANNSIEKVAETLPKRKGKAVKTLLLHQTIDEAFLEVIDRIREKLAKAFKKHDENLTSEELTEATQRTVDRLVFIRFLEDKLIEQEHWVSEFGKKGSVWNDFISACRKLDAKYNGIVFKEHFIDEQNFAGPDESEFRTICQDICHLNSRFLFNEIPIHILGSIYERFLGKVVHATAKRVTVEEKPEVQKAGGVYYTPKYIVDYIVRNTVGKLIEGKTPEQIAKLRFADIACGSGSFLIGVFDCLLDYHNKYYQKRPDKAKKDKCIEKNGLWVLSIKQKQKILLNNIYGVDIDQQATEVTQLSLALKLMEDETTATANEMMVFFHEKILPDMSKNIICGNSLIGMDILYSDLFSNGDTEKLLNPMNFEDVFKDIMRNGGFDAIVGNPPYVDNRGFNKNQLEYFYANYSSFTSAGTTSFRTRKFNTFVAFIEVSKKILNDVGICGYIIHKNLLKTTTYRGIRLFLLNNYSINKITDWGPDQFENVVAETISIFISKKRIKKNIIQIDFFKKNQLIKTNKIEQSIYESTFDNIFNINLSPDIIHLISKIENGKSKLGDWVNINNGIVTGNDSKFISKAKLSNKYKTCVTGKNIKRYSIPNVKVFVLYDSEKLMRARNQEIFEAKEKLIMQMINIDLVVAFDNRQLYNLGTTYSITVKNGNINLKYILSLLNSKLLNFYYLKKFTNESTLTNAISTKKFI